MATTDAHAIGDYIPEFHGAAGREVLTAFQKNSQYEHREPRHNSSAPIPKSDHGQGRQRQVGAEVLHFVVDVQAADRHHQGRRGGRQRADDDTADQHGPEDQHQSLLHLRTETELRSGLVLFSKHATFDWRSFYFFRWGEFAVHRMKSSASDRQHIDVRPTELWSAALAALQPVRLIPLSRLLETDIERRNRTEAELPLSTAYVQTTARLSVGLGGIPRDPTGETGDSGNLSGQLSDGNLHAAPKIHRIGLIVSLRCQNDALGGVLNVKKFPSRRAVAPQHDFVPALVNRFHALTDQRWNHVG